MEVNTNSNNITSYIASLEICNLSNEIFNRFPAFHEVITPNEFWKLFLIFFERVNHKQFLVSQESKSIVFTLIYYFFQNDSFYKSPNLHKIANCEIRLNKGLIIVGGFGVGKTSILKTFALMIENLSINFNKYPVRFHNSIEIVEEFENSLSEYRNDIINRYSKGFRIFDDIKNEREASNYGKVDLFKEILYKRYENKNFRTILLCNYDSEFPNDMHQAIESFERYGDRNYDRLFEAYNFLEYKGKSHRK